MAAATRLKIVCPLAICLDKLDAVSSMRCANWFMNGKKRITAKILKKVCAKATFFDSRFPPILIVKADTQVPMFAPKINGIVPFKSMSPLKARVKAIPMVAADEWRTDVITKASNIPDSGEPDR